MYSGALIDEAMHFGNLPFKVWEKMQETVQYSELLTQNQPIIFI